MQNLKTKSVKRVYTLTKKNSRKKVNKNWSLFQRFVFFLSLGDKNFLVQSKHGTRTNHWKLAKPYENKEFFF